MLGFKDFKDFSRTAEGFLHAAGKRLQVNKG